MKEILLTSSILILVLGLLRYLLRGRINLHLQYALWLLVAVRLLVPLSLPAAPWSVLNAVPQGTDTATTLYVSSQGISTSPPAPATGWTADDEAVSIYYDDAGARHFYPVGEAPPAQAHYTTVPSEQIYDLHTVLWTLWLGGAAVMTVWFLSVNLIFRRRAARSAQPVACAACPVPVYVTDTVPSPCLVGLFRQRIYVTPACLEDPARLRHVLAHELTHRRHGDPWWSLVRGICLCLYWFDPLVWWAAALSRRDCELSCDEGAIHRLGQPERLAYGRTLVDLVAAGGSPAGLLQTATTMRSGSGGLRERIGLIARQPRMLAITAVGLLTAVAIVAACTFTGAQPDRTGAVELPELGISLSIPEGLTLEDYNATLGYGGGYLLSPDAYSDHGDGTPPQWAAGGMAGSFPTAWLTWDGDAITGAAPGWNHTGYDEAESLTGMAAPAALLYAEHDLYTAAELGELETSGVDLSTLETSAAYWYVFLAQPGDDTGILLSLNAKQFTREDVISFARSVEFTQESGNVLTAEERTAAVRESLTQIPAEYADQVVLEEPSEDGETFHFAYYYAPDYDSDYGGWLFWVDQWSQAEFENHLCAIDTSGVSCFARDVDGYYYAVHCPTDVNFSPENSEDYLAVQEGLLEWAEATVLAVNGVEPFTEKDVQALRSQPFQFQGDHITATYYPYYAVNGDREITWTFILSRPVTQGEGGIWCVEQIWFAGEFPQRQVVRPDTDLPMAEYYAELQAQADAGQADWALDPMEVCLRYAHSFQGGHLNATSESFALSEVYSSAPYSGNEEAAEDLIVLLDNDAGRLEATLDYNSGGIWQADALSVSTSALSVQTLLDTLTGDGYSWVETPWTWPIATDPWASEEDGDYFLSLSVPDTRCSLRVYRDSPYVQYTSGNGTSVIYQVTPVNGTQSAAAVVRAWYDEQRNAPLTADVQVGLLMDAIRSNDTLVMELTRADGVGGGRYVTTPSGADNADYTAHNFTSPNLFTWSRAEGGMPPSPEPEASLTLSSPDGRYAIQVWTGSDLVCCTDSGETYWLQAESTGQDVFFSGSIFQHLRFWYDEVELAALQGDVVIPDTGQDHLAIAQAWVDAMQAVHLQVTPGSKYALTYVRNVVTLEEDALDSWYQPFMLETEHFYFSYVRIFVPENEVSLGWNMAGNTGEYDGSYGEAPEGAMMNWQMGPMYRTDEGWRCDGTGTGP